MTHVPPASQQGGGPAGAAQPLETVEIPVLSAREVRILDHDPEVVRAKLAHRLYWLLVGVLAGIFLLTGKLVIDGRDWTVLKDLYTLLVAPVVTLASFAFGFFFGGSSRD